MAWTGPQAIGALPFGLLVRYGNWITGIAHTNPRALPPPAFHEHLTAAEGNYASLLGMANALARSNSQDPHRLAKSHLASAEPLLRADLGKT